MLENGNPLSKLKEINDFERFRDILEPVFENTGKKSNAGRKPIDPKETEHVLTEPSKEAHGDPVWLDAGYAGMENGKYLIDDVENETAGTVRRLMHKMPH